MSALQLTTAAALAAVTTVFACDGDSTSDRANADPERVDAGSPSDASPEGAPDADPGSAQIVPTDADELFSYLQANQYAPFAAEPSAHPSAGPHQVVRSYFNDLLDGSLRSGASSHPVGSAVVKELFDQSGTPSGWAVMVKTDPSPVEDSWYFYEVLSVTNGQNPVADEHGRDLQRLPLGGSRLHPFDLPRLLEPL